MRADLERAVDDPACELECNDCIELVEPGFDRMFKTQAALGKRRRANTGAF